MTLTIDSKLHSHCEYITKYCSMWGMKSIDFTLNHHHKIEGHYIFLKHCKTYLSDFQEKDKLKCERKHKLKIKILISNRQCLRKINDSLSNFP